MMHGQTKIKIKSVFIYPPTTNASGQKDQKLYKIARNAFLKCALQDETTFTAFINIIMNIFTR